VAYPTRDLTVSLGLSPLAKIRYSEQERIGFSRKDGDHLEEMVGEVNSERARLRFHRQTVQVLSETSGCSSSTLVYWSS
jgi:hypothetical protein